MTDAELEALLDRGREGVKRLTFTGAGEKLLASSDKEVR